MRDFESIKRQILERVDILDLVSEHVRLKRSGRRWVGLCPFHAEKTPSFTVQPDHASFKCFGCEKGGDIFSFVQFRENVSFMESMRMLADRAGVDLADTPQQEPSGPSRADLARVNAWALKFFRSQLLDDDMGRSAREYLRTRQVSGETAERFGLGLAIDVNGRLREAAARAGIDSSLVLAADLLRRNEQGRFYDTFRNRLMFPIREVGSRVIGFGGRTLVDDRAKYLNTAQNVLFDKGRNLYGIDLAREAIAQRRRVIVVEGYTDCMAAHQAGYAETVATLGTALTEAQVKLLRRYCEEIILLFDSDHAGEAAAERAIRVALPQCVTVRLAHIPDGQDPSDFLSHASPDAFSDLLNAAVDALEFKWLRTRERFVGEGSNARQHEGIIDFLRVVAEAVDTSAVDVIQRGLLVNQVAHLMRMDRGEVDHLMGRLQSGRRRRSAQDAGPAEEVHRAGPTDGEQAAWTHVLEVVLNEPGALRGLDDWPDVARIVDERDRRIARIVFDLIGQLVTELARRGADLDAYEATLRNAFDRIRCASDDQELERRKQRLLEADTVHVAETDVKDVGEMIHDGVKKHRHFAPRRLIRQSIDQRGQSGQPTESPSMEQP